MHAPAAAPQLHRMLQVQHLVVDDVFEYISGYRRVIEDATDDDGIVRRIVVAEDAARLLMDAKLRKEFGRSARAAAIERYSTDRVIPQYIEFYERILKQTSS